ncbi:MAG: DUF2254 domain-containing protein [Verrucomicrobiaceae bacterium]
MTTFISHVSEKIRASAWTIPSALVISAIILSQFILWADTMLAGVDGWWKSIVGLGDQAGARSLLATIATSMLAVAGVSFSSIMVTMALASQQFGPRLLRNFIKDKVSQTVLGALLATFTFCIFAMRGIKEVGGPVLIPHLSILIALLLALVCLTLFIRFVHHILSDIQVEEVTADAFKVLQTTIKSVFPEPNATSEQSDLTDVDRTGWEITAGKTGYIQAIDFDSLIETARKHDAVLATLSRAGHFTSDDQPVIRVIEGPSFDDFPTEFAETVRAAFFVGNVRTPEQDFEYGVRQLVEIALRALSPGINDPITAMNCIDYLGAGLQLAFSRPLPPSTHRDIDENVRLFTPASSYGSLVEASFNQVRQAAREKCDVSCCLLEVIARIATTSNSEEQQRALLQQATLINQDTLAALFNDHDCEAIRERFARVLKSCHLLNTFEHA